MISHGMAKANAVLAILEDMTSEGVKLYLEPYQNGREHGWALSNKNWTKKSAFSENQNSDNIVVYFGDEADFGMAGNVPSEKVCNSKRMYPWDGYVEAAKFILEYLAS